MFCLVIELVQQFICCFFFSFDDVGCQVLMIECLCVIGFIVELMDFGDMQNFWVWCGYGEMLVFVGYIDVVLVGDVDCWINFLFELIICDGMLFGCGVVDMKGLLVVMVVVVECFVVQYLNYRG